MNPSNLNHLLEIFVSQIKQSLQVPHGFIYLVEPAIYNRTESQETWLECKIGWGAFSHWVGQHADGGEGLVGQVGQNGQPYLVEKYDGWADRHPNFPNGVIQSIMAVPLYSPETEFLPLSKGDIWGVIGVANDFKATEPLGSTQLEWLKQWAELVAIVLGQAFQLSKHEKTEDTLRESQVQLQTALQETEGLFEAARSILGSTQLVEICRNLTIQFNKLVRANRLVIYLVDHQRKQIILTMHDGNVLGDEDEITYHVLNDGISGQVFRTGQPVLSLRADDGIEPKDTAERRRHAGTGALIVVPLMARGQAIGTATALNRVDQRMFTPYDVDLLMSLATQAATAIENMRLFDTLQKANLEISQTLENLKATQRQLVQAEKMAALGRLVAGVAHEINTPIGIAITMASTLKSETGEVVSGYQEGTLKGSTLKEYLNMAAESSQLILSNLQRAGELVQSFKQVAVDQSNLDKRDFAVKAYIEEVLVSLKPKFKPTQHTLEIEGDESITMHSYPGAFSQIVTNLVINSISHAYPPGQCGHLHFNLTQQQERLIIEYADDGGGISSENLSKIFDPFFTTARHRGGVGLGLHIVYNLVTQKLKGTIRCESQVGSGTKFIINLPL